MSAAEWASAVLGNGLGRYEQLLGVAQRASDDRSVPPFSNWALAELVEAATRTGNGEAAANAAGRLAEIARATRTNWAHGIEARSRALLSNGAVADGVAERPAFRAQGRALVGGGEILVATWMQDVPLRALKTGTINAQPSFGGAAQARQCHWWSHLLARGTRPGAWIFPGS